MERILGRDVRGSTGRFFRMLARAHIPYLWILAYILVSFGLTNLGISATEYSSRLFAGDVGFVEVVLPFILVTIINLAVASISTILSYICNERINRNARRMIWGKVVRLPLRYYSKHRAGELVTRITSDVTSLSTLIMQVFVSIITVGYSSIALVGKISSYDPKLAVALLLALPLEFLLAYIMGRLQFGLSDLSRKKSAEMTQSVKERTKNYLLIKSSGGEEKAYESGAGRMKDVYHYSIVGAWMGFSGPMYAMAGMIQFILIVLVGRSFYADGTLSLAQWIAYYGFANQLFNSLSAYCNYWTTFKSTAGATKQVAAIMAEEEEDVNAGTDIDQLSGDIALENVDFAYEAGKNIFENLTLHIPSGRTVAIVGPSGSGKTTLLNLIERMYPIQSGSIRFGDLDVTGASLRSFRRRIAYLTQECTLFSGTLRENLLFGVGREVSDQELLDVCAKVDLADFVSAGGGLDMLVGESGGRLSGGQRQRVALARALLSDARYLFMDEATTAMDVKGKDIVWDAIRSHMDGGSVVMVAHDQQTVLEADYIIVVQDGKIVAQGDCDQVARENEFYRKLARGEDAE